MELFWGLVKIDQDLLSSHPFFVFLFLVILVLSLFITTLGKPVLKFLYSFKKAYLSVPRVRRKDDWIADCKDRRGWIQKGDAMVLELEGKYLKELTFVVQPQGSPDNWRGGLIIGNPTFSPITIVDSQNAITCHVGEPPVFDEAIPVWVYDKEHERNNPYSAIVKSSGGKSATFLVKINEDNYLTVEVQNQVVYAKRIDPSLRKKVYLLAWGDGSNCKVIFSGITYYI